MQSYEKLNKNESLCPLNFANCLKDCYILKIMLTFALSKKGEMQDNHNERFPIVDEEGRVIGSATRGECHNGSKLLHPVVHLHVFKGIKGTGH